MKGFKDSSNRFHPITNYKGVRKSRDQKAKTEGVILKKRLVQFSDMSEKQMERLGIEESNPKRMKRKMVLMKDPKTQEDKNHILSSVLGSKQQFKNSRAGENEKELWFTANVMLRSRGWEGKINRTEFDKWIELERKKRISSKEMQVDPAYGLLIANGYEDLKHNPNDPKVKKAYKIFIKETLDQARKLQKNGMEFQLEGYKDANAMFKDIKENKHLLYRPSDKDYKGVENHPMFQLTNIKNTNGDRMRVNDVFRAIHDINGHSKAKAQFSPNGELTSYNQHKKLYSKEATRALFTETQGQGMWVNFNKKSGKKNQHAQKIGDFNELDFPKQKAGIFPDYLIFSEGSK